MYISKKIVESTATTPSTGFTGLFFNPEGILFYVQEDGSKNPVSPSEYVLNEADTPVNSSHIGKGVSLLSNGKVGVYATTALFFGTLKSLTSTTAVVDCNMFQTIKLDATSDSGLLLPSANIVYVNILSGGTVVLSTTSTMNTIGMYIYNSYNAMASTIKMKLFSTSDLIFIERNSDIIGIFEGEL